MRHPVTSLAEQPPQNPDNFSRFRDRFCPPAPGSDLVRWLWRITPPNAPTVPVFESVGRDDGPGHVPLVTPPSRFRVPDRPTQLRAIRDELPPGHHYVAGETKPRAGGGRWKLEAAYDHDLLGESQRRIGERLGLYQTWGESFDECRGARRYYRDGRKTLAALGAWPWTLAELGRLPAKWWERDEYADALHVWHRNAFQEVVSDALVAVDALGEPVEYRWLDQDATDLYGRRLEKMADVLATQQP